MTTPARRNPDLAKAIPVVIPASRRLRQYLSDMVEFGSAESVEEAAELLVWRGIEGLLSDGIIDRRGAA